MEALSYGEGFLEPINPDDESLRLNEDRQRADSGYVDIRIEPAERYFMPRSAVAVLFLAALGSTAALVSGGPFLETALPGGLPAGNLLSAVALCSLAVTAVGLSRPGTTLRYLSVTSLVAASAWLPVSIALAGNLALNFDGFRGQLWIWMSLAVIVLVLLAALGATIDRLVRKRLARRSTGR